MRFIRAEGLWTCGPDVPAGPNAAVLEVSGAVLAWTVDDPSAPATITFTDVAEAEWLWRVLGEDGHVTVLNALDDAEDSDAVDLPAVHVAVDSLESLRRLAFGHWLRRWWPASARDGIVALDGAVVDAEIAVLTVAAQDYFADDTFDSDVAGLLRPHLPALAALAHDGDPRAGELASACLDLADDVGAADGLAVEAPTAGRRDDYALAAGAAGAPRGAEPIASGVGSVDWAAVPPGLFDAADRTVEWAIEVADAAPVASVRVATSGAVAGIEVRVRAGTYGAAGELTPDGRAVLPIVGTAQPMTEDQAWGHDWSATIVSVGADVAAGDDAAVIRDRIRTFARARLAHPGPDAFLAEVLAAEADY
jgi:hypothetical protein